MLGCRPVLFRADAAFAKPEVYEYLEPRHIGYAIRLPANEVLLEGKYALNWTRLSCHRFDANQVRLQLFILAYNLGNLLRRLGLPKAVKDWSLRSLQVKLIKMGRQIVRHARRIVFQLAEVAVPGELFAAIIKRVTRLRIAPG
jgi:hypothetical protein